METGTETENSELKRILEVHPDDVKIAEETAKGVGETLYELAIGRANQGDFHMTIAALTAAGANDEVKYSFLAAAFENAAKNLEKRPDSFNLQKAINLRNTSNTFRKMAQEKT